MHLRVLIPNLDRHAATKNILFGQSSRPHLRLGGTRYGLQVTVDQAAGRTSYRASAGASHPITSGRPVLEGEGVSPVAVDLSSGAEILIPYNNSDANNVSVESFKLFNQLGQEVLEGSFTNQINLSGLNAGLYYLEISGKEGGWQKIIKE